VIRKRRHNAAADTSRHEIRKESKVDSTRYTAAARTPAATGAKKLNMSKQQQQKKPAGDQPEAQRKPKDPKAHYDTPRAQRQTTTTGAGTSGHGGTSSRPVAKETQRVEMSAADDKDMYEVLDPERESIYEETF
jgi:hypothetical protein